MINKIKINKNKYLPYGKIIFNIIYKLINLISINFDYGTLIVAMLYKVVFQDLDPKLVIVLIYIK